VLIFFSLRAHMVFVNVGTATDPLAELGVPIQRNGHAFWATGQL